MQLADRTGLLTGAAGGIGTAIARRLAGEGVRLVLTGRDTPALERLRDGLPGDGHAVVTADLSRREDVDALVGRAERAVGPLDLLVNNAGIEVSATFHRLAPDELDRIIAVNLVAPMLLTHAVVGGMVERGRGHVVQMASVAGLMGTACGEPYGATKGGLVRLTESLRATYAGTPLGFSKPLRPASPPAAACTRGWPSRATAPTRCWGRRASRRSPRRSSGPSARTAR